MKYFVAILLISIFSYAWTTKQSVAETIPYFKVLSESSFEIPKGITSRLYLHGTETTHVLIYTTTGKIMYNLNETDPKEIKGFTLNPMNAIMLTYELANAFRAISLLDRPSRLYILELDLYPFQPSD